MSSLENNHNHGGVSYQQQHHSDHRQHRPSDGHQRRLSEVSVDYSHLEDPTHGTSTVPVATFNLVATIVGGGVLSVPFAFAKMGGVVWGIGWMLLAGFCTDQSCLMLCWSARPHNSNGIAAEIQQPQLRTLQILSSYGQVGREAFGPVLEVATSALLFIFLVFVLIAYMVLVKDIWTPILLSIFKSNLSIIPNQQQEQNQEQSQQYWGPFVLLGVIAIMFPFLIQKTLHALRFNCYIGFFSVSMLCLALCHHALFPPPPNQPADDSLTNNKHFFQSKSWEIISSFDFWLAPPQSYSGVLPAIPIFMLSFLCHFNVNPIQKALLDPTPRRVGFVIHGAMVACAVLMILFGIGGYAYVLVNPSTNNVVQGNILLNCSEQQALYGFDPFLYIGRVGCGITIMLAMAIMMLPCRDSLLEVIDIIVYKSTARLEENGYDDEDNNNADTNNEQTRLVAEFPSEAASSGVKSHLLLPSSVSDNGIVHYVTTFLIVAVCYISAIKVPGVAVVWSLCGSTMAFVIAFILPAACYLAIIRQQQQQQQVDDQISSGDEDDVRPSKALAWILLLFSILAAIVCTTQTIHSMLGSNE